MHKTGEGLLNNSEDAFCLLSHTRLYDVAMLMILLSKQFFWLEEPTDLRIGAETFRSV